MSNSIGAAAREVPVVYVVPDFWGWRRRRQVARRVVLTYLRSELDRAIRAITEAAPPRRSIFAVVSTRARETSQDRHLFSLALLITELEEATDERA